MTVDLTSLKKPGQGFANFLKEWYRSHGWSRAEASRKGQVSEGYLCHLFAGDVQLPRQDLFWGLVDGWDVDEIEALMAARYLRDSSVDKHLKRHPNPVQRDLRPVVAWLVKNLEGLSPEEYELMAPRVQAHYVQDLQALREQPAATSVRASVPV